MKDISELAQLMKWLSEEYGQTLVAINHTSMTFDLMSNANVLVSERDGEVKVEKNRWGKVDY